MHSRSCSGQLCCGSLVATPLKGAAPIKLQNEVNRHHVTSYQYAAAALSHPLLLSRWQCSGEPRRCLDLVLLQQLQVWAKMDALQPCGSFKLRGIGHMTTTRAQEGVSRFVSSSGGNAGIAVACVNCSSRASCLSGLRSSQILRWQVGASCNGCCS